MDAGGVVAARRLRPTWSGQIQRPEHFGTTVMISCAGFAQRFLQFGDEDSIVVEALDFDFAKDENFRRLFENSDLVQHDFSAL
jgi:hypothetical protein